MSSAMVARAIERAGLAELLEVRRSGRVPEGQPWEARIDTSDILVLGAAANQARRLECGDEARVYVPAAPPTSPSLCWISAKDDVRGTQLLRRIAGLRLLGPVGLRIVVDWASVGLEIAQVALSFGATDLAGPIASRRGLPLVDATESQKLYKRREIAGFIERAGFRPVFVQTDAPSQSGRGAGNRAGAEERS